MRRAPPSQRPEQLLEPDLERGRRGHHQQPVADLVAMAVVGRLAVIISPRGRTDTRAPAKTGGYSTSVSRQEKGGVFIPGKMRWRRQPRLTDANGEQRATQARAVYFFVRAATTESTVATYGAITSARMLIVT